MDDQAESSRRAPPMTPPPPPPPSPAIPEDSSTDAILWADSDECSSSTPRTDLLSLWLSNYTALPQPEVEEEPLADVPTMLNFDLESSFPDLVDWNTTSATITQAPAVTEPLWVQLHAPPSGEEDNLTELTLGIQSPKPSISPPELGIQSPKASVLPLALGNQFPKASALPLAPGIQPPLSFFEIQSPQASISPLALGTPPPKTSSGIETLQASLLPLAHGIQAFISPPVSTQALGIQSPQTSVRIPSAPASFSGIPSIPSTLPMAPPFENLLPSPSPVPERRSWSEFQFPSTPPPVWRHLLLPQSASLSMSSPSGHPIHQTQYSFSTASTGYQQQLPVAHAPVTSFTPNANASSFVGFDPASQPSWSQAMAQRGSWTPNQPWISNDDNMKLPIPRHPRILLPPGAPMMPEPSPPLANFGSSIGNIPNSNVGGDIPVEDQQQVQTGKSSRPSRKKSQLAVRTDNKLIFKK